MKLRISEDLFGSVPVTQLTRFTTVAYNLRCQPNASRPRTSPSYTVETEQAGGTRARVSKGPGRHGSASGKQCPRGHPA